MSYLAKENILMLVLGILSCLIAYYSGPQTWWFLAVLIIAGVINLYLCSKEREEREHRHHMLLEAVQSEKDIYDRIEAIFKEPYNLHKYRLSKDSIRENNGVKTYETLSSRGEKVIVKIRGAIYSRLVWCFMRC